ncbi:transglutaminase family protein [Altererythrobacter salegens]|uniref:Transglutaminase family protein n=1 Tax=Croceibacterium salegens TaxID=1737568 RepID=A0A6I4SXY9_9SPHN|nr:transglutaminase family protein [Croceibacterium salegens]MXO60885.1 transglutaminase family protein [Croceibacterium salegens]
MPISVQASFSFDLAEASDVLLHFEAAAIPEQQILSSSCQMSDADDLARVPAHDSIGERLWMRAHGTFLVDYSATVEVDRLLPEIESLTPLEPHDLPGEAVEYLLASRYCQAERFQSFVHTRFEGTSGGARIATIRDWIAENFTYALGSSNSGTTALDSFVERRGVCRDYAHVLIALARASAIPARYVSAYAPGVKPQDFHALAEVFLADPTIEHGGAWHLIDATGMADPAATVKIGVGRDAADVSFMTVFGEAKFGNKKVAVEIV